ncbi:hypothetical protein L596_017112 [Steinernema carpocapsae]|uniref:Transposase Tc5 C-terminal domain-containing protein n=1 Tax=Steinernema carpocapsae TaxID=34508 RepID=A0A4U5N1F8_STECR|nr:hypothetical protein L596_017112 [Steinernema carpocapsae]
MTETVIQKDPSFVVSQGVSIGRLLHLTFGQFGAPRFQPMLKYAWFSAGLVAERFDCFKTLEKYCFGFPYRGDTCASCGKVVIVRCSLCKLHFCLANFVLPVK